MQPQEAASETAAEQTIAAAQIVPDERNVTLEVFRALADPVRLELLAYIAAHGPICVCHLEERLGYSQSRVSKHLGTLRRAGLVRSHRNGTWVYYELEAEALDAASGFIGDVRESGHEPRVASLCAEPKPAKWVKRS